MAHILFKRYDAAVIWKLRLFRWRYTMQKLKSDSLVSRGSKPTILLIDTDLTRVAIVKSALQESDYVIVAVLSSTEQLATQVQQYSPDVLVIGADLPNTDMLQELNELSVVLPLPIILFTQQKLSSVIRLAIKAGVTAYVVDDIYPKRIDSIIMVAVERFAEEQLLRKQLAHTQAQLADRKILERAKGLLMEQKGLSEAIAFARLRKMAMDKGQTLVQVSKNIIEVCELITDK